jgi:hypothetical protein
MPWSEHGGKTLTDALRLLARLQGGFDSCGKGQISFLNKKTKDNPIEVSKSGGSPLTVARSLRVAE